MSPATRRSWRASPPVEVERPDLSSPKKVANPLRPVLADRMQEECHVLLLDTRNRLIRDEVVTVVLADCSHIHPREVFRAVIRCEGGCTRIILVHSHPSGDPTPSPQDLAITRQIAEASKVVGIELVDHVIIGRKSVSRDRDFLSLREAGEVRQQAR